LSRSEEGTSANISSQSSVTSGESTLIGSESAVLSDSSFGWDRRSYLKALNPVLPFNSSRRLSDMNSTTTNSVYRQSYLEPRYGGQTVPQTPISVPSRDSRSFLTIRDSPQPVSEHHPSDSLQMEYSSEMALCKPSVQINVLEYNGMCLSRRLVADVEQYLHHRSQGWTGILINGKYIKTLRPETITKHIMNEEKFAMVKSRSLNQFKQMNARTIKSGRDDDWTLTRRVRKRARIT
jgi:hypothetical protein